MKMTPAERASFRIRRKSLKNDVKAYSEYRDTMNGLQAVLERLRHLEDNLTAAASEQDTETMNALVTQSEPDMLKFRGLEARRAELEKALGISGKSFDEVLGECTDEQRKDLSPVLDGVSRELKLFANSRDNADRIMKVRLFDVNEALKDLPVPDAMHDTLA